MAKYKVKDKDFIDLAKIYNTQGKKAVYEILETQYEIKTPYYILRKMYANVELSYDAEKDYFLIDAQDHMDNVFMSMEELCSPMIPQHIGSKEQETMDSRPAAMDKLIRELIGDRLLELSKYVTIDSLSKRVIVDKTTLSQDGYQLVTY